MLEKVLWSNSSNGTSAAQDGDSNRRTSCFTSDEDMTSNQCIRSSNMDSFSSELCAADPILGDRAAAIDNNLYRFQLTNGSNNGNDLGFFSNNAQDKELDYGWPEIENFEDVDRMFRSCDSTFGLEIEKHDELGWFSSVHEMDRSDDALKSGFNFSGCDPEADIVNEHHEICGPNSSGQLANEPDKRLKSAGLKKGMLKSLTGHSAVMNYSYDGGSGAIPQAENGLQIESHIRQVKEWKSSEGNTRELSTENGDSFIHLDNLKPVEDSNYSLNLQHNFGEETRDKHENRHQTCIPSPIPPLNCNDNHISKLDSPRSSTIKIEDNSLPSVSPRDSSYESNNIVLVKNPVVSGNRKKDKSHQRRSSDQLEKNKSAVERADSVLNSVRKHVLNLENEVEGYSEADGNDQVIPGELDSPNIVETSCVSSVLDDVSITASNFRQLQHVMEQLDVRTKLCIRDSLYRLARSAEQRHKCVNRTISDRDDKDERAVTSDETNKSTGYMDMETDTNPIDRSIAHLLFHRPSDPSSTTTPDAVSTKSCAMAAANGLVKDEN